MEILKGDQARQRLEKESEAGGAGVEEAVAPIIAAVRERGDSALRELAVRFGETAPDRFRLAPEEIRAAVDAVPPAQREVIERAAENIGAFASAAVRSMTPVRLEREGFTVGLDYMPVNRVGCYVPGGRYPLPSTALMTALPARSAGVREICIVSPRFDPPTVLAGMLAGVDEFYRVGGAQAVAALAFGTASIPAVDMVVGPGNAYVTEAKRRLNGIIGIDMLAGPSEVAVIADSTADPQWVALELLAQWEHDPRSKAWLFTNSAAQAEAVAQALTGMAGNPDLPDYMSESVDNGAFLVFETLEQCAQASNRCAPEHLALAVADPQSLKETLTNYGALFLGTSATVAFGDYMAGPNHTLPTGRTARFTGGLSPLTFLRPLGWTEVPGPGPGLTRLAEDTAAFAALEGLPMHEAAARARLG